ncbi:MAG TPA: PQQ-binding-like beta-propeller repeat protein [Acidimicrobiales bacterium]
MDPREAATSYQQNAAHDGRASGTVPMPPLARAWSKPLSGAAASYPVIAGGRAFVLTGDNILYALDMRNGATLWSRAHGSYGGTLSYDGGRLYVTDDHGFMLAADAATGRPLFGKFVSEDGPPVATGGRVFAAYGMVFDGATGTKLTNDFTMPRMGGALPTVDAERVYISTRCKGAAALNRALLTLAWRGPSGGCTTDYGGEPSPVYANRYYNSSPDDEGDVHDAQTGTITGHFPNVETPAFAGELGLFVSNGRLTARDVQTDQPVWTFAADDNIHVAPVVAGNYAYVTTRLGNLFVVDLRTGAEVWRTSLPAASPIGRTNLPGMAIAQGTLLVASGTSLIAFRNAQEPPQPGEIDRGAAPVELGPQTTAQTTNLQLDATHSGGVNATTPTPPLQERWRVPVRARNVLMASGRVFVSLDDGTTRALDPVTGATLWNQPGAGGSIAYDRNRVFAVNTQRLAALDAATGAIVWQVPSGREGWPALVTASDGELYVNYLGWIVRHDPATGARTWSYGTHNTGNRAVTLEGPRVWVGGACAPLDRATGQPTREDDYDLCADSTFAVAPFSQGHLIENNGFYAMYDIDTQREIRSGSTSSAAPPAILGNVAVTGAGGYLSAWEFPSWTPRWRFRDTAFQDETHFGAPPLIVGRTLYYLNRGSLRAFDVETGALLQQTHGIGYLENYDDTGTSMAVGDGLLLVPGETHLIAYESA